MKKVSLVIVLLSLLLIPLLTFKKTVQLEEQQLVIENLDASGQNDFDWVFETFVDGQKKHFEVYQWIIGSLARNPECISVNLSECDEQCWDSDKVPSIYLGQTPEGVHMFAVDDWIHGRGTFLLFLEVLKYEGATLVAPSENKQFTFNQNQVIVKKIGCVPLGGRNIYRDVTYEGNELKINGDIYRCDLSPPSGPKLLSKLPYHFDRPPYFNAKFLDNFGSSMRTGGTAVIAYDLELAHTSQNYAFLGAGFSNCCFSLCEYVYEGKLDSGIHIVRSDHLITRPVVSLHFLLVFESDYEITANWKTKTIKRDKKRVLVKKMGELDLHLSKPFVIDGNTISYTDAYWDNRPYVITGDVTHTDYTFEVELKRL